MTAARRRDEPASDETPARGMAQTDTAIKAQFARDEKGALSGSLKVSGKVALIAGALLGIGGTALGYFGHGEPKADPAPAPVAIESRVVALEVERKGDDKRIEKLEDAMRDLDKDVRKLLEQRAKSGG